MFFKKMFSQNLYLCGYFNFRIQIREGNYVVFAFEEY